jgi:hypothetical protein
MYPIPRFVGTGRIDSSPGVSQSYGIWTPAIAWVAGSEE